MNIYDALETRISCRAFEDRMIEKEKLVAIQEKIAEINNTANLHLQLYGPDVPGKPAIDLQANVFAGPVYHYIACTCHADAVSREKTGYYGEQIVLMATQMGLGTCWILTNFNRNTFRIQINPGEQYAAVILLGYAMKRIPTQQWLIRAGFRKRDKTLSQAIETDTSQLPEWFINGVKAAQIGPSGVNLQPTVFCWKHKEVSAYMPEANDLQDVDFGIAKYHFELGSKTNGVWEWGEHGKFILSE